MIILHPIEIRTGHGQGVLKVEGKPQWVDPRIDSWFEGWSCDIWRHAWTEAAVSMFIIIVYMFILNPTRFASHSLGPPVLVSSLEQLSEMNNTVNSQDWQALRGQGRACSQAREFPAWER